MSKDKNKASEQKKKINAYETSINKRLAERELFYLYTRLSPVKKIPTYIYVVYALGLVVIGIGYYMYLHSVAYTHSGHVVTTSNGRMGSHINEFGINLLITGKKVMLFGVIWVVMAAAFRMDKET